ncbi:MAG: bifunctional folylpolyglutamate synthase/dihydrofolate synthase [Spirochaetaceae bacterium]|jgi:dihydrofolate synthase/folylpolyglutamate synthase|nr:bifunctional folylpolyglutamate synthase/dihydrofolate synthase [Spirochaetaceae bacterium]
MESSMEHDEPLFSSSDDVFAWLSRFIGDQFTTSLRLDRMETLARLAGNPEKASPAIHVAGSKGKGSVTGMTSAILSAGGFRPGRYTSPHVTEYRERITAGDEFFDEQVYIAAGKELAAAEKALRGIPAENPDDNSAGFFELLTLYFFLCARQGNCNVMTLETGLGGRFDATNIVDPAVSAITLIELEHTEFLGNTISAIAGEKAGIIKPGRPLVLAEQPPDALQVFKTAAADKNAPFYYLPEIADIQDIRISPEGTVFSLHSEVFSRSLKDLKTPLVGAIQAKNAGLAAVSAKIAFPGLPEQAIPEGLAGFALPARFERVSDDPVLVVDGAHTARSTSACAETFKQLYGHGGILLFGCAIGKDAQAMAEVLLPLFSVVIITTPGTYKVSVPQGVYDIFRETAASAFCRTEILCIPETVQAIKQAVSLGKAKNLPILGTGSFYLAAEIRNSFF